VARLVDAYQAEVIELSELAERRRRIEDHGRMLRERVRAIAQQRSERSAELRLLEGVDAFCTSVRGAMEDSSFTVQQNVLQSVVNLIVVEDSQVIIEHVVPTGPVRLQTEHHRNQNLRYGCLDARTHVRCTRSREDASSGQSVMNAPVFSMYGQCWSLSLSGSFRAS
jgi:hypothetical protein